MNRFSVKGTVSLLVCIPKTLHKAVKMRALQDGTTMVSFVIRALEEKLATRSPRL